MKHLFVVAHPDDEVLGAGAFIFDAVKRGDEVGTVIFNSCDMTRYEDDRQRILSDLIKSHEILGISQNYLHNYEDGNFHLADHRKMVQDIEEAIRQFSPDCIYTHHPSDNNNDHIVVFQACMEAFRLGQRGREGTKPVKAVYLMEILSSSDWGVNPASAPFVPNTFCEVSENGLAAKNTALQCYENVIRPAPFPRSAVNIHALAKYRGCQSGYMNAEAFQCVFRQGV